MLNKILLYIVRVIVVIIVAIVVVVAIVIVVIVVACVARRSSQSRREKRAAKPRKRVGERSEPRGEWEEWTINYIGNRNNNTLFSLKLTRNC